MIYSKPSLHSLNASRDATCVDGTGAKSAGNCEGGLDDFQSGDCAPTGGLANSGDCVTGKGNTMSCDVGIESTQACGGGQNVGASSGNCIYGTNPQH